MSGMSNPQISVIIPTFNRVRLVVQAIDSVLKQSFHDFEIVVIDDGSSDDTGAVIQQYTDPRVRYIYQENTGLAGARNAGIRAARGQYVAFLDADDLFLPHNLDSHIAEIERHPQLGLVAGGFCIRE